MLHPALKPVFSITQENKSVPMVLQMYMPEDLDNRGRFHHLYWNGKCFRCFFLHVDAREEPAIPSL